jgi:hypothetical protein
MRGTRWIVILLAFILIGACYYPWVIIESRQVVISGFHSTINDFGKPGMVNVFLCAAYIICIFLFKNWSIRAAFFISTVNIAWAARNFLIIAACRGGICPDKQPALYILLIGSVILTILTLTISVKEKKIKEKITD